MDHRPISPDEILDDPDPVLRRLAGRLSAVVVVGLDADSGQLVVEHSLGAAGRAFWLLNRAGARLIEESE